MTKPSPLDQARFQWNIKSALPSLREDLSKVNSGLISTHELSFKWGIPWGLFFDYQKEHQPIEPIDAIFDKKINEYKTHEDFPGIVQELSGNAISFPEEDARGVYLESNILPLPNGFYLIIKFPFKIHHKVCIKAAKTIEKKYKGKIFVNELLINNKISLKNANHRFLEGLSFFIINKSISFHLINKTLPEILFRTLLSENLIYTYPFRSVEKGNRLLALYDYHFIQKLSVVEIADYPIYYDPDPLYWETVKMNQWKDWDRVRKDLKELNRVIRKIEVIASRREKLFSEPDI